MATSIGYDNETDILEIEFKSGEIWQYLHVPDFVLPNMLASESLGRYFQQFVKGKYEEVRVR
jgi:hypothetical protein